jgi:hypothetical protein
MYSHTGIILNSCSFAKARGIETSLLKSGRLVLRATWPDTETRQFGTKTFRYHWKKVSNRHRIFFQTNVITFFLNKINCLLSRWSGLKTIRPYENPALNKWISPILFTKTPPLFFKINHYKKKYFVIQILVQMFNVFSIFVFVRIFCFCFIIFLIIYLLKLRLHTLIF